MTVSIPRRTLLRSGALGLAGLGLGRFVPAWAQSGTMGTAASSPLSGLSGDEITLRVAHSPFTVGGRSGHAVTINGTLPAPLLRLREGQRVRIHVDNALDEDTSIHWHGLLVPFQMDGVPGVSFPGIRPGARFTYDFPIIQSGTYWYHSHSGLQEPMGHYGPIIIDPAEPDPIAYDREHVIVLSDWSFLHPHRVMMRLKQEAGYFNRQRRTLLERAGHDAMPAADAAMFAQMRMDPTDIADVTGATYHYLINGHGSAENWTGLFRGGERVRLRIINSASQTIFNFRIPGLAMTVVAADGQNVRSVEVDEFQIGNAETYDVIVTPRDDRAYGIVAEAIDRSGMVTATLAPRLGMRAEAPPLRARPLLTMTDMGMGGMAGMEGMDHAAMGHGGGEQSGGAPMQHDMRDTRRVSFPVGPGVDMIASMPIDRMDFPGIGLDSVEHRVLNYRQLAALAPRKDAREPSRRIEVHLTGNMERFMWSLDGERLSENPEPYRFARDERVRMTFVNDSMMTHPMHLHGHFFELVNGHGLHQPMKHTVRVFPGGTASVDFTADAPGDWVLHCHLLYHMHAGMMRVVTVRPIDGVSA
ncbi:MAG: copper resistance system multicopper oxidase [Sphingopyxis sp.]